LVKETLLMAMKHTPRKTFCYECQPGARPASRDC
jgi:hypothetical protein